MEKAVYVEAIFFLTCLAVGVLIAFVYDILRISRRIVSINALTLTLEDIIFFIVAAGVLFFAAYIKNGGEVRLQGFIGSGIGLLLYAFVVRNHIVDAGTAMVRWLMGFAVTMVKIILFPVRIVLRALKKPVAVVAWHTGRGARRVRRVVRSSAAKTRIRLKSTLLMLRKK